MLERPGRNKAYFNTGGMVKIRFILPRPNSELYAFFRPGQSIVNFFVSGGQSTPITLFYALDGHRIYLSAFKYVNEVKRFRVLYFHNILATQDSKYKNVYFLLIAQDQIHPINILLTSTFLFPHTYP